AFTITGIPGIERRSIRYVPARRSDCVRFFQLADGLLQPAGIPQIRMISDRGNHTSRTRGADPAQFP
ncbi:MAG: hypothetical protein PVF61_09275, partial [Gammaproteobacteria bacterium]